MHVLTKIFVVLVALLTVALVPLVAMNATNEASFQKKFKDAEASAATSQATLAAERSASQAAVQKLESDIRAMEGKVADLQKQVDTKSVAARKAEQELAGSKAAQASVAANLELLAQSGKANSTLTDSLVAELRSLRTKSMDAEKRLVDIQEAFDASQSSLEVADAARRAGGRSLGGVTPGRSPCPP